VIQLDANYLVLGSIPATRQAKHLQRWLNEGELLSASAIAWMEFVTGPVTPEVVESIRQMLEDRITAIGCDEAELAAGLFNLSGRKRTLRHDSLIASAAILSGSRLATNNRSDFALFVPHGLQLARAE
jgi:predicted nucleic acid-binding protein